MVNSTVGCLGTGLLLCAAGINLVSPFLLISSPCAVAIVHKRRSVMHESGLS